MVLEKKRWSWANGPYLSVPLVSVSEPYEHTRLPLGAIPLDMSVNHLKYPRGPCFVVSADKFHV